MSQCPPQLPLSTRGPVASSSKLKIETRGRKPSEKTLKKRALAQKEEEVRLQKALDKAARENRLRRLLLENDEHKQTIQQSAELLELLKSDFDLKSSASSRPAALSDTQFAAQFRRTANPYFNALIVFCDTWKLDHEVELQNARNSTRLAEAQKQARAAEERAEAIAEDIEEVAHLSPEESRDFEGNSGRSGHSAKSAPRSTDFFGCSQLAQKFFEDWGHWVQKWLDKEKGKRGSEQPYSVYDDGKCILHAPDALVAVQWTSNPLILMIPDLLIINPVLLFPRLFHGARLACPDCRATGQQLPDGTAPILTQNGWGTDPFRWVQNFPAPMALMATSFRCNMKRVVNNRPGVQDVSTLDGHAYTACDQRFIDALPPTEGALLREGMRVVLTHASGATWLQLMLHRMAIISGTPTAAFQRQALHTQSIDWDYKRKIWLLSQEYQRSEIIPRHAQPTSRLSVAGTDFPQANDPLAFLGPIASAAWDQQIFLSQCRLDNDLYNAYFSSIGGSNFAEDHSFKASGHLMRIDGQKGEDAVWVFVQDEGLVRAIALTATKAHQGLTDFLRQIEVSMEIRGNGHIKSIYVDDFAHYAAFFSSVIGSLTDLAHTEQLSDEIEGALNQLALEMNKANVDVHRVVWNGTTSSEDDVDKTLAWLREGTRDMPRGDLDWGDDDFEEIVIMDGEWIPRIPGIDVLTLGTRKRMFMIQIKRGVKKLPISLEIFLTDQRVKKVGHFLSADNGRVAKEFGVQIQGRVELRPFYNQRRQDAQYLLPVLPDNKLATLCKAVTGMDMVKDSVIRLGLWSDPTESMMLYAWGDVFCTCRIFLALAEGTMLGRHLGESAAPGDSVRLQRFSDPWPLAYGQLMSRGQAGLPQEYPLLSQLADQAPLTTAKLGAAQWVVRIDSVALPSSSSYSCPEQTLSQFGPPPFELVCGLDDLRVHVNSFPASAMVASLPRVTLESESESEMESDSEEAGDPARNERSETTMMEDILSHNESGGLVDEETARAAAMSSARDGKGPPPDQYSPARGFSKRQRDQQKRKFGQELRRYPGVYEDVFHALCDTREALSCDLHKEFAYQKSRTVLVPLAHVHDQLDRSPWLEQQGYKDAEALRRAKPELYHQLVPCVIEPPEVLGPRWKAFMGNWIAAKDEKGTPLFTDAARKHHPRIVNSIEAGALSDPPSEDVQLYRVIGTHSGTGMPIYKCSRGSNRCERFNLALAKAIGGHGLNIETLHHLLLAIAYDYNHRLTSESSSRQHSNLRLMVDVDTLSARLFGRTAYGIDFVNPTFLAKTHEKHGVQPITHAEAQLYHIQLGPCELSTRSIYRNQCELYGTTHPVGDVREEEEVQNLQAILKVARQRATGAAGDDADIAPLVAMTYRQDYGTKQGRSDRAVLIKWAASQQSDEAFMLQWTCTFNDAVAMNRSTFKKPLHLAKWLLSAKTKLGVAQAKKKHPRHVALNTATGALALRYPAAPPRQDVAPSRTLPVQGPAQERPPMLKRKRTAIDAGGVPSSPKKRKVAAKKACPNCAYIANAMEQDPHSQFDGHRPAALPRPYDCKGKTSPNCPMRATCQIFHEKLNDSRWNAFDQKGNELRRKASDAYRAAHPCTL